MIIKIKNFIKKNNVAGLVYAIIARMFWYLVRQKHKLFIFTSYLFSKSKIINAKYNTFLKIIINHYYSIRIKSWNFNDNFDLLIKHAKNHSMLIEEIGNKLIKQNPLNPKGYALIESSFRSKPLKGHYNVGIHSLAIGHSLVKRKKLLDALDFYTSLNKIFPEIFNPYVILYNLINQKLNYYRKNKKKNNSNKKLLLISFSIWGDQYVSLFTNYCIPSMITNNNIPKIKIKRDVKIDIYSTLEDKNKLEKNKNFLTLSNICEVNFIIFPKELINCQEYKRNSGELRYMIYGGFHHLSIERAKSINADIMCLGPDNIHSNNSLSNYVNFIDQGYPVVLFTAIRGQAEYLESIFDEIKKDNNGVLDIPADQMINISSSFIHHDFMKYIITSKNVPDWQSQYFIPNSKGFYIRGFHLHPVIIANDAISNDIEWDFSTADNTMIQTLFPNKSDWDRFKVINNSFDGVMIDMTYKQDVLQTPNVKFHKGLLDKMLKNFDSNHLWNFKHPIEYITKTKITKIKGFKLNNNKLESLEFNITKTSEKVKKEICVWYDNLEPK